MFKTDHKKAQVSAKTGQAATELAVFGAVLIFILGAIVRSAAGNSYTQNQNFKAMRMAMLASWNGSKTFNFSTGTDTNAPSPDTSRNNASILFLEDRLSPDLNKYGDIDRTPYVASGSGTFTYGLMYPLQASEANQSLPIMDMYINGQHFPFTTASFVPNRTITRPACSTNGPYETYPLSQAECLYNQCLRNKREWAGGVVNVNQFENIVPVALNASADQAMMTNATNILNGLVAAGLVILDPGSTTQGTVSPGFSSTLPSTFKTWFVQNISSTNVDEEETQVQGILQNDKVKYKLFYSFAVNGTTAFHVLPRNCATLPCQNHALSTDLYTANSQGVKGYWNGNTQNGNYSGDMMFDLLRNADYAAVNAQFPQLPAGESCPALDSTAQSPGMRCNVAWQWYATPATTATSIGLDVTNNQYPTYDVDGRLKEVTIYSISQNSEGDPVVSYEDSQGGDIDSTWDSNSCTLKPGLQNDAQIFTFTKDGTYLQIKEGELYNPETGQVVRSENKRDTIDLVQRMIQLSNNTGRFCSKSGDHLCNGSDGVTCVNPNPVEACVNGSGLNDNCFSGSNGGNTIAKTCYDTSNNMLYVRSRIEDRRGSFWMTNASGQLKVQ